MENTRTSISKQFLGSLYNIFIGADDNSNGKIGMSDLKSEDWKDVSDADKMELLKKSPERMKTIVNQFLDKVLPKRRRTSFASGTALSKNIQGKEIPTTEIADDGERDK